MAAVDVSEGATAALSGGTVLADVMIPVPPDNGTNGGTVFPFAIAEIKERTLLEIEITGTLSFSAPTEKCGQTGLLPFHPLQGKTVGPRGSENGDFRVEVLKDGFGIPVPEVPGDFTTARRLVEPFPGTIQVWRPGTEAGCNREVGDGGHVGVPALRISGKQRIVIREVEAFKPSASPTFVSPPGDSVTLSVTSQFTLSDLTWFFQVGDTLAEPAGFPQGRPFCPEPNHTCRIAVPASGRVYLDATIDGMARSRRAGPRVWVRDSVPESCAAGGGAAAAVESDAGPVCPPEEEGSIDTTLTLSADSTALHPWVRSFLGTFGVNGDKVPERVGSLTPVRAEVLEGSTPLPGVTVSMSAEFTGAAGGHPHYPMRVPLASAPPVTSQSAQGRPLFGYFRLGNTRTATLNGATDQAGRFVLDFVAGFVGGEMDLIANATVGSMPLSDTLRVQIRVPGLINLEPQVANAYYVGGTTQHTQGTNWFVRPDIVPRLRDLANLLHLPSATVGGVSGFVQFNDASLPLGGSFTVNPQSFGGFEQPFTSHESHAVGVDIDFGFCVANVAGDDGQQNRLNEFCGDGVSKNFPGNALRRNQVKMFAKQVGGCVDIHNGDHYHIRFPQHVPLSRCR